MIELKNVSKFYYSKGVIASGFTKINLKFKVGEFIAITGESGSGKSTLLNVISGLDTYEEGEMYINGEETSHYTEKDFEIYRRKYIGNIFQSFNLVNSYTVYQNIELVLLLNGEKRKDIKEKVIKLIKKVDLYKFRNTKVSKLSGGQKQRVAIARALAKETPIIIADEPTGNLDSESAKNIMEILSKISKDKLVIIVTHNFEQVEEYATRRITMNDGKILEDKVIKQSEEVKETKTVEIEDITFANRLRIGIRNTFNIIPKFLLVFAVYLFITVALLSEYSSFKEQEYLAKKTGYNYFFDDISDKRIIIKKQDKTAFSDSEYEKIKEISNIEYIIENDVIADNTVALVDGESIYIYVILKDNKLFEGTVDIGRLPEAENEILICGSKSNYYIGSMKEEILERELYLQGDYSIKGEKEYKFKVVGIKYIETQGFNSSDTEIYVDKKIVEEISKNINSNYTKLKMLYENKYYTVATSTNQELEEFILETSDRVQQGKAYVYNNFNGYSTENSHIGKNFDIEVKDIHHEDKITLTIDQIYNSNNIESLLGIKNDKLNTRTIYINTKDYERIFNNPIYQSSVYVKEVQKIGQTAEELHNMGYSTLCMKDTLVNTEVVQILQIFRTIVTIILVIGLFFITYFIIKIILKSRNVYFSTIRMLGASKRVARNLLIIELLTVTNIAYFSVIILINFVKADIIENSYIANLARYVHFQDYAILYIILIAMSYLVSRKFAKKLFKKSTISTIKEEV